MPTRPTSDGQARRSRLLGDENVAAARDVIDIPIVGAVVATVELDFSLRVICSPPSGFTIETPVV
jgi:hypothetical protein